MTSTSTHPLLAVRVRLAALSLDRELAAGGDPTQGAALAARARLLASPRRRRRVADGLRRVLASTHRRAGRSTAAACDRQGVAIARPALEQLERAIRERPVAGPQGLAQAHLLLCDPDSALYLPAHPEQLYEEVRAALLALAPRSTAPRRVPREAPRRMARVG